MKTKIRHLYPTPEFTGITSKDGVPLRWLESLVQDARNRILAGAVSDEDKARVMREADSAMVYGAENLRITYTDELTSLESMTDLIAERDSKDKKIRDLLSGEISTETIKALRDLLGINSTQSIIVNKEKDSQAPLVISNNEPIVPVQKDRKTQFLEWVKEAGWSLPGNEIELTNDGKRLGFTLDEAREWLSS